MHILLSLSAIPLETQREIYLKLKQKFERDPYVEDPPITREELLNKDLSDIGILPISVYNMLTIAQIRTVGQLVNTSRKDLQKLRGFGKWSLNQVEEFLMLKGLCLKE